MPSSLRQDNLIPFPARPAPSDRMPAATGEWEADNAFGRDFADDLVSKIQDERDPSLLGALMRTIIDRGTYGGVEVGFFHRLAVLAAT